MSSDNMSNDKPTPDAVNALTDRLNELLTQAEAALIRDYPGISAYVSLQGGHILWLKKHNGEWGLYVDAAFRLVSAPMDARIAATKLLPVLQRELNKEVERLNTGLIDALAQAAEFVKAHK